MNAGYAIVRLWRYRVDAPMRAEFGRYAGDGDRARLFAQGEEKTGSG